MKFKFIAAAAMAVCVSLGGEARKIHTIGDSTMADQKVPGLNPSGVT